MIRRCVAVKENFYLYQTLIGTEKIIDIEAISESKGMKNGEWVKVDRDFSIPEEHVIKMQVAWKVRDNKYGLRVFFSDITDQPAFYFDSDGPAHYNFGLDEGLLSRSIPTPHFNFYNVNGIKLAKRSTFINENEPIIQSNINVGMNHFCDELNINTSGKRPAIYKNSGQLPLFGESNNGLHDTIVFE